MTVEPGDIYAELDYAISQTRKQMAQQFSPYHPLYIGGIYDALDGFRRVIRSQEFVDKVNKEKKCQSR